MGGKGPRELMSSVRLPVPKSEIYGNGSFEFVKMFEKYLLVKEVSLVLIYCPGIKQPAFFSDKTIIDSNTCRRSGGNYLGVSHASSLTRALPGRFKLCNTCTSSLRIC